MADRQDTTISAVVRDLLEMWVEESTSVFEPTDEPGIFQVGSADWWARTKVMSIPELIGSILARAQIIEEFMRMYIAFKTDARPREVRGTFGSLRKRFRRLYPEEIELLSSLDVSNEVRNDAAHSDVLVAHWLTEVLEGHDPQAVDRLTRKGVQKALYVIQECLVRFLDFAKRHPLPQPD